MVFGSDSSSASGMYSASRLVALAKSAPGRVGPRGLLPTCRMRSEGKPSSRLGVRSPIWLERMSRCSSLSRPAKVFGSSTWRPLLGMRSTLSDVRFWKMSTGSLSKRLLTRSSSSSALRPLKSPAGTSDMPLARRLRKASLVKLLKMPTGSVVSEFSRRPRNSSFVLFLKMSTGREVSAKKCISSCRSSDSESKTPAGSSLMGWLPRSITRSAAMPSKMPSASPVIRPSPPCISRAPHGGMLGTPRAKPQSPVGGSRCSVPTSSVKKRHMPHVATTPEPGAPSTLKLISGTSSGASEELVALVPRFRLLLMSGDCAAALTSEGMPVQRGPCRWLPARASAASAASTQLARIGLAGAADVRERRGRCAAPAGAAPPLVAAEAAAVAGG
mmetsp:Transcript_8730/g.35630  ORF Transcript_8730/g.35630 Transcript_8730/m.35630 type:complete len:387 (+) Transcript_8730:245-1405(+)